MAMRMLIDARHPEETRVAVVKGNRIEEFDFESADHKQLKGNIYLAKVTRVEPSLQAAFVDYGGNRHGFLAFSEIHPDYYRIPQEDREALLREEAEHHAEEEALRARRDAELEGDEHDEHHDDHHEAEPHDEDHHDDEEHEDAPRPARVGGQDDAQADALRSKRMSLRRRYKIQDVIVRRQMLLVQVVKEERGNKGAALTTYLSLAGRYCVLMPNTSHGGGISRKISNAADRKRLKSIMSDLQLPPSMGCIVRTAGLQRTKIEIKRDFDYLTRLWDDIREHTLTATAPALIHEDSDLLKRAIRDIYNRDIDEVVVEGENGFRHARNFMKMLMPSHAKKVTPYVDAVPLFQRNGVEGQLEAMYQPVVQLKSGGYIVINPTEALVSIDINSGRSTREHNIEETALKTNLEAADEIARQLRLRDMAGLVVIDFIDMEVGGNVRKVERAMKEALKNDRARIQIGRISSFGLMEMSRQRLRTGVLEASTHSCPTCQGTGLVRNIPSAALSALRALEEEAVRGRASEISLRAGNEVAIYILNRKRSDVAAIEATYGVAIEVLPDDSLIVPQYAIEASGPAPVRPALAPKPLPVIEDDDLDDVEDDEEAIAAEEAEAEAERRSAESRNREDGEGGEARRRGRRRRRRGGRRDEGEQVAETGAEGADEGEAEESEAAAGANEDGASEEHNEERGDGRRRRRRGRRGGRRHAGEERGETAGGEAGEADAASEPAAAVDPVAEPAEPAEAAPATRRRPRARKAAAAPEVVEPADVVEAAAAPEPAPEPAEAVAEKPKRGRGRRKAGDSEAVPAAEVAPVEPVAEPIAEPAPVEEADKPAAKPRRARTSRAKAAVTETETDVARASPAPEPVAAEAAAPEVDADGNPIAPRRGWWQRTFGE